MGKIVYYVFVIVNLFFCFKKDSNEDKYKAYNLLRHDQKKKQFEFVKLFKKYGIDIMDENFLRNHKVTTHTEELDYRNNISITGLNWFKSVIEFSRIFSHCKANFLILLIKTTIDSNVFNGLIDWVKYLIKFMMYCKFIFLIQKV